MHKWLLLLLALFPAIAWAQPEKHCDWQDGQLCYLTRSAMKTPPVVESELNGNKYLKVTATYHDCQAVPSANCTGGRVRAEVHFTAHYTDMPLLTSTNNAWTYKFRFRWQQKPIDQGIATQGYQNSTDGETIYESNSTGPVWMFWRNNNETAGRFNYAEETKSNGFTCGDIGNHVWFNLELRAVWSHDPSKGRLEAYCNGVRKLLVTGRDSNLGPDSNRLPQVRAGIYGSNLTSGQSITVHIDDVHIFPTGGVIEPPTPSVPPCQ